MTAGPRVVGGEPDDAAFAPTVWSAIAHNAVLVCVVALLGAVAGVVVTKLVATTYTATSTIALTQPQQGQTVGGTSNAPNPSQYLDSQVVLLGSSAVAQAAADDGNATLHEQAFTASDFSGPDDAVTLGTQTTTDPNSTVVAIEFSAKTAAAAQAGANALVSAYLAAYNSQIKATTSSIIAVIDNSLSQVNNQLSDLSAAGGTLNTQLATSLVSERATLESQRSQALVNESANLSQPPPTQLAYLPTGPNGSLAKRGGLGLVIGLVVGVCLAYAREVRRTRAQDVAAPVASPAPLRPGMENSNGQRLLSVDPHVVADPNGAPNLLKTGNLKTLHGERDPRR